MTRDVSTTASMLPPDDEEVFVFPASFAQRRLWLIDQLEPGRSTYNIPVVLQLEGPIDVGALHASLTFLVERHEALRTVFEARDGEPMQVIRPPGEVALPVRSVARTSLHAAIHDEANRPFDLATGPVIRAVLFALEPEEHVLLLVVHHVATDGWSIGILLRELAAAYDAFSAGSTPALAELPLQYADFAVWQREWLDGGALATQLDYWRGALAGPLPVLELPGDRARGTDTEKVAERAEVQLSRATSDAVRELARASAATPFMVLLTAFQLLLSRVSGQDDVLVGTPIAGRTRREMEGVVGFFVNTLALRARFPSGQTFRELLARTRETTLAAFANADVPFEQLVEIVQPERDRTRNPIFQALFSVQDLTTADGLTMRGLRVAKLQAARETAKFDVQLLLNAASGIFRGALEYDASLLDASSAAQLAESYGVLLDQLVADPDRSVDALRILGPDATERTLAESAGPTRARAPITLGACFADQAARTPDEIAIRCGTQRVSYAELDARSDEVARGLRARGVGRDVCVGICIERSVEMVVAVLGVLKAGGTYVPVDPAYPSARVRYMIENAGIRTILVSSRTRDAVASAGAECLELAAVSMPGHVALPLVDADALAYVIYTSGSTGTPKGVAMPHAPLVNLLEWQRAQSMAGVGTRTLQFASLSFDVSFQEIFSTWSTGGTLVLVDDDTRRDPDALLRLLRTERVERLFLPYIALQHLADAASGREPVSTLREIITAGEQLRVTPSVRDWLQSMPDCTLTNQYGPTESHVVTAYTLRGAVDAWDELPPIGWPIDNARVYILDRAGQPTIPGARGEIFLGGAALARGYLGAPDKTAERFLADPFATEPDARMYRTGDLGRRRGDGAVEYLGRIDGQVKLRGFRIELGEVEAVIARDTSVAACAATVREDVPGERRLVAYVVPASRGVDAAALRDHCRAHLPEYMIPAAFVPLELLPLTPSGKIDRRSLPAPTDSAIAARGYVPPAGEIETIVAGIWSEVLRVERVGRSDDFFDLGGHSLIATRMVSRVRDRLGREIPLRALFDCPILSEFVAEIERTSPADSVPRPQGGTIARAAFRRSATDGGGA